MSEHRKASVKANDPSAGTAGVDWSVEEIRTLVGRGYISEHKHPTFELWIFNYTSKTQYEALWTPETSSCRGLILDGGDAVVARPLRKFFGLGEPAAPPVPEVEPFEVFEKLDGSLIVTTVWRWRRRGASSSPPAVASSPRRRR